MVERLRIPIASMNCNRTAPLIGRLTGKPVLVGAARAVGARAATIIGMRIVFMSAGAWLTVGTITIQALIWGFTDDALQDWVSLCAFGKNRDASKAYSTAAIQYRALKGALNEVGVRA